MPGGRRCSPRISRHPNARSSGSGPSRGIEGQPALLFAAPLVAAIVGPTQSDHRSALQFGGAGLAVARPGRRLGRRRPGRPPDSQGAGGRVVAPDKGWCRRKRRRRAPRSLEDRSPRPLASRPPTPSGRGTKTRSPGTCSSSRRDCHFMLLMSRPHSIRKGTFRATTKTPSTSST